MLCALIFRMATPMSTGDGPNVAGTAAECGRDVGIMGDLQGPKIRISRFRDHSVKLEDGDAFFLDCMLGYEEGKAGGCRCSTRYTTQDVAKGDVLLLNDGMIELQVDRVEGTRIHTIVDNRRNPVRSQGH